MQKSKKVSVSSNELNPEIREILEKYGQTVDGLIADLTIPREIIRIYLSYDSPYLESYECALYILYCLLHPECSYCNVKRPSGRIVPVCVYDVPKEV